MIQKTQFHCLLLSLFFFSISGLTHAQGNLVVTLSTTPACSTDGSVTAVVTGGTPPYTYSWYTPMQGYITNNTPSVTGGGGSYYLNVVDFVGNAGWGNAMVAKPFEPLISITPDFCGQSIGQASVTVTGGTPPYSYAWSSGHTTATVSGLPQGTYQLTITDAAGCYLSPLVDSTMYISIYNTSPLNISTSSTASACASGTASVTNVTGGTPPYSYAWNSTPPQFTATATGLGFGNYQVTVSDASGCTDVTWAYVPQGPNSLIATTTTTPETCIQSNGTASITVFGGVPPISYLWSNGATTSSISGLQYGYYSVTATDANSCPIIKVANVARTEPLNLGFTAIQPNCSNTGGALTVNVTGGAAPLTYQWNIGATTQSISNLTSAYYYVAVTDANGCQDYSSYNLAFSSACYARISGKLYRDVNPNCLQDPGETAIASQLIDLGNGYWDITDNLGEYMEDVLPGNYSISIPSLSPYYAIGCPVGGTINLNGVTASGNYPNNDFAAQPLAPANDLSVWGYASAARPTVPQIVLLYYQNMGNTPVNGTVNFTHDALMSVNYLGGALYTPGTRTLTWNVGMLAPGDQGTLYCEFTIPTNTAIGTSYAHAGEILPIAGDAAPANNTWQINSVVVGSYDPNDKQVTPAGMLTPGIDSLLTYTIRFQNTGTDTAFTVAIRDTLDSDIDPFSIEVLGASHTYTWDIDAPGYMTFTFDHIMLPDSHINEAASHGFIAYRARIKPNLPLGTEIKNTAAIYFDYNVPVVTNTTLNTFGVVGTDPGQGLEAGFTVHPNPTHSDVQIRLSAGWQGETEVSLMDLGGRKLRNWTMDALRDPAMNLQLTGIPAGIYLLQCHDGIHQQVRKLVVQ